MKKNGLYSSRWDFGRPRTGRRVRFGRKAGGVHQDGQNDGLGGGRLQGHSAFHSHPHLVTASKVILTTSHLDHGPANNADDNLAGLCQKYHNSYDAGKRQTDRMRRVYEAAGQMDLFENDIS